MLLFSFHAFFLVCWHISVFDSLKFSSHVLGEERPGRVKSAKVFLLMINSFML
jgi:predicted secreted protein